MLQLEGTVEVQYYYERSLNTIYLKYIDTSYHVLTCHAIRNVEYNNRSYLIVRCILKPSEKNSP